MDSQATLEEAAVQVLQDAGSPVADPRRIHALIVPVLPIKRSSPRRSPWTRVSRYVQSFSVLPVTGHTLFMNAVAMQSD